MSTEEDDLREALKKLVFSEESDQFRDDACRHLVAQPYADNRYVRLLDDVRRLIASPHSRRTVPQHPAGKVNET